MASNVIDRYIWLMNYIKINKPSTTLEAITLSVNAFRHLRSFACDVVALVTGS